MSLFCVVHGCLCLPLLITLAQRNRLPAGRFSNWALLPNLEDLHVAHDVFGSKLNTYDVDAVWNSTGGKLRWVFYKTPEKVDTAINKAVDKKFDIDQIVSIMYGQVGSNLGTEGGDPTALFSTYLDPKLQAELSRCEMLSESAENDKKRMEALIRLYSADNLK